MKLGWLGWYIDEKPYFVRRITLNSLGEVSEWVRFAWNYWKINANGSEHRIWLCIDGTITLIQGFGNATNCIKFGETSELIELLDEMGYNLAHYL